MTKKFTFALKPVLDQRERIEDERAQALAARQRELTLAQDELARLNAEFRRHTTTLREDHREFTSEQLRLHYAHLDFLDRAITAQERVVATRRAEFERARELLVDASKDRKAIEKLQTRKYEQFVALESRLEQRDADDANERRYSRAQQAPGGLS